jgi:CheY-like chemotaxis protein
MLCDDLIFFSRVESVARASGVAIRWTKTVSEALKLTQDATPKVLILDLHLPELELETFLQKLPRGADLPCIVAYGSHVEAEVLRHARKAGCDRVMPRSQFVEELERELPKWLSRPTRPTETGVAANGK